MISLLDLLIKLNNRHVIPLIFNDILVIAILFDFPTYQLKINHHQAAVY